MNTKHSNELTEHKLAQEALRNSEERYRTLFDTMTEGFALHEIVTDAKGQACDYRFLDINPAFERLTGLKREDLVGKRVLEVLPRTESYWIENYGHVVLTGEPLHMENYSAELGRWYAVFAYRSAPGRFAVIFSDITARKRAEQALRESQERFHRLFEDDLTGDFLCTPEGQILLCNPAFAKIFGFSSSDEAVGTSFLDLCVDRGERESMLESLKQQGKLSRYEAWRKRRDGELIYVVENIVGHFDDRGELSEMQGYIFDDTERKQAEIALQESEKLSLERAAHLQSTLDAAPSIIWTAHDRECRSITGNRAAEEFLRVPQGADMSKTGPSADRLSHYRVFKDGVELKPDEMPIQRVAASGIPLFGHAIDFVFDDGTVRTLLGNVVPVPDEKGQSSGAVAAFMDITEHKRAEEALRQSEERFRAIVSSTPDHVFVQDRNLRYTMVINPQLGLTEQDMIGKTDSDILAKEDAEKLTAIKRQVLENGKPVYVESPAISKDGKPEFFEGSYVPKFDAKGQCDGLIGYFRNVTERKRMEDELRKSRDELELRVRERTAELQLRNQELQDFAFVASHDLNEPLRKIQSFGDMVTKRLVDFKDEASKDYLKRMQAAAARMQKLLNSLLSYSRLTTKADPMKKMDLRKSVEDSVSNLLILIREKNAKVEIGDLPTIKADMVQMTQLFQNLIGNALKFHRDGQAPHVKIHAEGTGDAYKIYVEDNGIGFDEKYLDKIFMPFQRLHGRSGSYEGVGMGLAICRKIVERHGGRITARSQLGKGSTFIVTLPVEGKS
jgi:PAS domain S-box-containing protein